MAGTTEDGTRVAAIVGTGGYAEWVAARHPVPIPAGVSDGEALALLLQGLTAWHLFRTCARVERGESVVVVAAAGGVGSLAVQLGKALGARVIATASSPEKRELARELGADVAVDVTAEDLTQQLLEANGGEPVDVVLETAGGRVFDAALAALAPFGRMVAYGISSREQNEVRTGRLLRRSQSVIGFWLFEALEHPEMVGGPLRELFDHLAAGRLRVVEGETYPLSEARRAHEDLQARRTTGKVMLDPRR